MNKNVKTGQQGGFTLIELIVVIVILGILAATALPKFANLGADARIASLKAAKGSLSAVVAMAHAKAMINTAATSVVMEGTTVGLTNGYPTANAAFGAAAGLTNTDYLVTPGTGNMTVTVVGAKDPTKCSIAYTEAVNANTPPRFVLTTTDCN